jgi:hypothetical protein
MQDITRAIPTGGSSATIAPPASRTSVTRVSVRGRSSALLAYAVRQIDEALGVRNVLEERV